MISYVINTIIGMDVKHAYYYILNPTLEAYYHLVLDEP